MGIMRTKFFDYDARRTPRKGEVTCAMCQRPIRGSGYRMVHLVNLGTAVLHPEDDAQGIDVQRVPIGPECVRKVGIEWTHPAT